MPYFDSNATTMDIDNDQPAVTSNADQWLALFSSATSRPNAFPFTLHKIQSIESRRARMSDLLIFDVLLIRGGTRTPDMFFPPADWSALRKLLEEIDRSIYDVLKKDCLVYIVLKWAWDFDTKDTNAGWESRFIQDRCIPPQFAQLADAYWLLDTGTHLDKAVSMLSDARLNRDYVSKILHALSLSSSPASFANGTAPATAALVVKYVRTAKPLLTEPDDIDLYALSLAHIAFSDAWAYQNSFPEESETRERLLRQIVGWCLMPKPKQTTLAQLLAFPLSPYEESFLHTLALRVSPSLPSLGAQAVASSSGPVLSSQAISILQELLCVRAIQSGDYIRAIKLDRQFSSSPNGTSSSNTSSGVGRETIDRRAIIQDLFTALPPAERMLLEAEIGKVATGVRASTSQVLTAKRAPGVPPPARRPALGDLSMSMSWDDLGSSTLSPAPPSVASSVILSKAAPMAQASQPSSTSPFASRGPRPSFPPSQPSPTSKFSAFSSVIPPSGPNTSTGSTGTGLIAERTKMLFSSASGTSASVGPKPVPRTSLFETAGSAKNAPNAFFKPPPPPATRLPLEIGSSLANSGTVSAAGPVVGTSAGPLNGKAQGAKELGDDVSMGSESDVEIIEEGNRQESEGEERDAEGITDEAEAEEEEDAEHFITSDRSAAADLTFHPRHDNEIMGDDHDAGPELGFSVFNGSGSVGPQNGSARQSGSGRQGSGDGGGPSYVSMASWGRLSPPRESDKSLNVSASSSTMGRRRAPPGAFHAEDHDESEEGSVSGDEEEEEDHTPQKAPVTSPPRTTRTRTQTQTPSRPPARSQPRRGSKSTAGTIIAAAVGRPLTRTKRMSTKPGAPSIPGSLVDEEHEEDETDHTDAHDEQDSEDENEDEDEEDDALAPLPSRSNRRTTRSGVFGTSSRSQSSTKSGGKGAAKQGSSTSAKGKAKTRPSEVRTPTRRSSRLSTTSSAASLSPEQGEDPGGVQVSPTKGKGRGSRTSVAGSATGTRSSTRRKR